MPTDNRRLTALDADRQPAVLATAALGGSAVPEGQQLDPKAKRQITQLLDTFIDLEKLKQRVNAQEA